MSIRKRIIRTSEKRLYQGCLTLKLVIEEHLGLFFSGIASSTHLLWSGSLNRLSHKFIMGTRVVKESQKVKRQKAKWTSKTAGVGSQLSAGEKMRLKEKVAIVTGGARGLGREIALRL